MFLDFVSQVYFTLFAGTNIKIFVFSAMQITVIRVSIRNIIWKSYSIGGVK